MPGTPSNLSMRVNLQGQVALVTGAGDGIGRAIALAYAANGASVVVNDLEGRGGSTVEEARQLGAEAEFVAADVSRRDEVERLAALAEERFGRIDILVNNAGVNTPGEQRRPIHEYDESEWRRILAVDLDGVFHGCRVISPGMAARKAGNIINIASVMGVVPIRLQLAYAAAKAAVIHFTRSIALELAPFGIRVNAIAPGSILTQGTKALFYNPERQALAESLLSHIPLGRPGTTEEIALPALFLASDASSYMTGAVMVVDGGWTAGFARDW
jgi:NAD(P)-dependent dehydrogenase (short-subunit alcohol dehydrogenase family)